MNPNIIARLTAADAARLLLIDQVRILDARDAAAFQSGHIEGATRLHRGNLDALILGSPRRQPVLIYCHHGNASQEYAKMFADFGYAEVYDMIGGYQAWRAHVAAPPLSWRQRRPLSAELLDWLIRQGFPLDASADAMTVTIANATTPLMHAARLGETERVSELIGCGAALDAVNLDGNNALWLACFAGNLAAIDLLLKAGIAIDRQNDNGATCLMYAASAGKTPVVAALLAAGADVRLESLDGYTALDMAANIECLTLLRRASPRQVRSGEEIKVEAGTV